MNLIHLTSNQTKRLSFDHPLLSASKDVKGDVLDGLIRFYIATGDKQAYQDLILGNLILVKWVVGRYLYHWPESRNFEDDMASEGIVAITSVVAELSDPIPGFELRAMMVARIKNEIEVYLNNNRSIIRASLRTNRNRLRENQELEYVNSVPLDEKLTAGRFNENLACIDILDSFESVESTDKEEFIDLVLLMLERHPQILESELPENLRVSIEKIVSAIKGSE